MYKQGNLAYIKFSRLELFNAFLKEIFINVNKMYTIVNKKYTK